MFRRDKGTSAPDSWIISFDALFQENLVIMEAATGVDEQYAYPPDHFTVLEQIWSDPDVQNAVALGKQRNVPDK